jgi:hypothetical protein
MKNLCIKLFKNFIQNSYSNPPKRINIILIFFLFFSFGSQSFGQDKLSALFIGNSYTAVNNLHLLVNNLTTCAGKTLIIDSHLVGGYTIIDHFTDKNTLAKIKKGNWNYVVIQEQSQIPSISRSRDNWMYPYLTLLKDTIQRYNPCAKIITYMTWGRRFGGQQCSDGCSPNFVNFNQMQDSITKSYLEISKKLNIQCAPVGMVWQKILKDTTLVLHQGDNSHSNTIGSYTAACTIFSSIWKKSASGLTFTTTGVTSKLAKYLQSASDRIISSSTFDWSLKAEKPTVDFSQSISGYGATFANLSTSINSKPNYFWDFGDGTTSINEKPNHTYKTGGTYTVKLTASNCVSSETIIKTVNTQILTNRIEGNIN